MIIEQCWTPCKDVIKMDANEIMGHYHGQKVNSFGYNFDLENTITETDFIINYMIDYWDCFVVPVADHILLKIMTEAK